jgi:hypothetical protein
MYEPAKLNDEIDTSYQSSRLLVEVKNPNHHKRIHGTMLWILYFGIAITTFHL